jgi:uncharacterized membrane protein
MSPDSERQIIDTLHAIRDGQREIIALLRTQHALAEEQLGKTQHRFEESVELQKEALKRQSAVTKIAIPGILACIAAIAYLVLKYF